MKISFHGAVGCVTGSCHLVETSTCNFLIDCGMFQGSKVLKERNYGEFQFDPKKIDFMLLTHAHIDHSGLIPKLVKKGFHGPVYATNPTVDLSGFLLPDSARIQESEVELKNRRNERKGLEPLLPIYDEKDAEKALSLFKGVPLNKTIDINNLRIIFRNAGHIFGSAFIEIQITENGKTTKIVFSGDIGAIGHPIVMDPEHFSETDYLLIESTYGDRIRPPEQNEDRLKELSAVVNSALKKGGNLIIPAFALERSQDLMHDLSILIERGSIPETEIIIDSPLAIEATTVYAKYPDYLDDDAKKLLDKQGTLFDNKRFKFTKGAEDSKELNNQTGKIILSASGMCDAGRIKHHLKHNLWRKESTILLVGYQAEGTLGRMLLDGVDRVRIFGNEVVVAAQISQMQGYSGHADQNGLLDWLKSVKKVSGKVFIVHGEDNARQELAKKITEKYHFSCEIPAMDSSFDLLTGKTISMGIPTAISPAIPPEVTPAISLPTKAAAKVQFKPPTTFGKDSYNLFAEFSLMLAEQMRKIPEETKRAKLVSKLIEQLKSFN
ncbi:MAG: MBL fold metallo-hydrolase [Candidatus Riflebacteria bacterium]|nr:MBL fold metallo-hydrolase [Candidatus Riflebacteria bacterium]